MSAIAELRETVSKLPSPDRAELVEFILDSLDDPPYFVSDEEVAHRAREMDSGSVTGLTLEEFRKACGRA